MLGKWHPEALMFEMLVGAATILSGVATVVMMILAVIDRLKRSDQEHTK
jgi:hypothetical protein